MRASSAWLALLLAWPAQAWAEEPPAPARDAPVGEDEEVVLRYPPTSVRMPIIAGGIGVAGIAYGAAAFSGATWDDVPGADALPVPVAGPWIALGQTGCAPDDPDCEAILYLRGILYVIDGIAQIGGLGLVAEGIFMTTEADAVEPEKAAWTVAPLVTPHATGVAVGGSF